MDQDDECLGCNDSFISNETSPLAGKPIRFTYPFSDPLTRAIIILNYTIVFLACFIGNVLVLFVIARNKRMRTRTNLFLANLAVADLCVGIICIFPNMHVYLFLQWYLGKVMCKVYRFVESMNLTASMLLLEVVAMERYIVINHPFKARRLFTRNKMYFAQFAVWMISSIYNIPILFMYDLYEVQVPGNNKTKYYCYSNQHIQVAYSSVALYDLVTFIMWYLLPLVIMTAMYGSMANTLWRSTLPNHVTSGVNRHAHLSLCVSPQIERCCSTTCKSSPSSKRSEQFSCSTVTTETTMTGTRLRHRFADVLTMSEGLELPHLYNKTPATPTCQNVSPSNDMLTVAETKGLRQLPRSPLLSSSSNSSDGDPFPFNREQLDEAMTPSEIPATTFDKMLLDTDPHKLANVQNRMNRPTSNRSCRYRLTSHWSSRRRVIRLLIIVLGSFAVLVLPNHVRLLLTRFHENMRLSKFVGPICHLLMFLNSAVNPVLYSLLSQSFRHNLKETIYCCDRSRRTRTTHRPGYRAGTTEVAITTRRVTKN